MGFTVRVNSSGLDRALRAFAERLPEQLGVALGVVAGEVCDEVAATVPSVSGRLSDGWAEAAELCRSGGGVGKDASVEVSEDLGGVRLEATCLVPYAAVVEQGDEEREAGNQLAVALENSRRRLVYGRGEGSISAAIQRAWEEASR